MQIVSATDPAAWDAFLSRQRFRPFLQSWAMGEVYRDIGQPPVRLVIEDQGSIQGICFGHIVNAKRGRHLSVPYGPIGNWELGIGNWDVGMALMNEMMKIAKSEKCSFVRLSPFLPQSLDPQFSIPHSVPSPLHLLAEQVWYIPLVSPDPWQNKRSAISDQRSARSEEEILMAMRKTTRNLIRRAERDGVEVTASLDPVADLETFIKLHDETRRRHGFTPYSNAFFRAQVKHFAANDQCTVYLAKHEGQILATSVHMHAFGETSYHHGASVQTKVPASYLLQWRAIQDALKRGDHVYNFWGIAPVSGQHESANSYKPIATSHPFSGVTLFKTGFGGSMLPLEHCRDIPIKPTYWLTYAFETMRKWRRGF